MVFAHTVYNLLHGGHINAILTPFMLQGMIETIISLAYNWFIGGLVNHPQHIMGGGVKWQLPTDFSLL